MKTETKNKQGKQRNNKMFKKQRNTMNTQVDNK